VVVVGDEVVEEVEEEDVVVEVVDVEVVEGGDGKKNQKMIQLTTRSPMKLPTIHHEEVDVAVERAEEETNVEVELLQLLPTEA